MDTTAKKHSSIEAIDLKPLEEVKAEFLNAGYFKTEVQDMVDAMSELPQYGGQAIQKSQ
jgi:hypothetical protein